MSRITDKPKTNGVKKAKAVSLSGAVMQQIEEGRVTMRPRTYFVLLAAASAAAVVSASLVTAYLTSMLFFWWRIQTADTMAWGARAHLSSAAASFPWWMLLLSIGLIALAVWLVKKQGRLYRHKTSTIVLGIILASILLGSVLSTFNIGASHTPGQRGNINSSQRGPGWQRNNR